MTSFIVFHLDKYFEESYYQQFKSLSDATKYFLSLRNKVSKETKGVQLLAETLDYSTYTNMDVTHIMIAQFYTKNNIIETFETEYKSEFELELVERKENEKH